MTPGVAVLTVPCDHCGTTIERTFSGRLAVGYDQEFAITCSACGQSTWLRLRLDTGAPKQTPSGR